jgi:phosphate transport system ATP-binding protein
MSADDPDPREEHAPVPDPATTPPPEAPPAPAARPRAASVPTGPPRPTPTARSAEPRAGAATGRTVELRDLHAFYGDTHAVKGVDLVYRANEVTAMIGPSGCGKSTLVRCINRMHEEIPGARAEGSVTLDDTDIYGASIDPTMVRRVIGMVFQKPNPFPTMSIFDNVAAGVRLSGIRGVNLKDRVEWALRGAGLWDEVKDRLAAPGVGLSGGQQQRLCIARTIAVEPEVILMDEPASALDPIATLKIEDLVADLKERFTIVIVTHNMQQAARVADTTAFMLDGDLIEHAPTEKIFSNPDDPRTEEYITGKFG